MYMYVHVRTYVSNLVIVYVVLLFMVGDYLAPSYMVQRDSYMIYLLHHHHAMK